MQNQTTGSTSNPSIIQPSPFLSPTLSFRPTLRKSNIPSQPLTDYPSSAPSLQKSEEVSSEAYFFHELSVSELRILDKTEMALYSLNMENYTWSIGAEIGEPFILSNCTVKEQRLGTTRHRYMYQRPEMTRSGGDIPEKFDNTTMTEVVLLIGFLMNYNSRHGYNETNDYTDFLLEYLNDNQAKVSEDLRLVLNFESEFIINAGVAFIMDQPPTFMPSDKIVSLGSALEPSAMPSQRSSTAPSTGPSLILTEQTILTESSLEIGSIIGIVCSITIILILAYTFGRNFKRWTNTASPPSENNLGSEHSCSKDSTSAKNIFSPIPMEQNMIGAEDLSHEEKSKLQQQQEGYSSEPLRNSDTLSLGSTSAVGSLTTGEISIEQIRISSASTRSKQTSDLTAFHGANLMLRDDSFSSDSNDEIQSPQKDNTFQDELDEYKNQTLEKLRVEVENSVDNVDGMISLAMTRIFTELNDSPLDLSWVGAEDPASIEASCYCEAFDWLRQNENGAGDRVDSFFQDMLNKIVVIVHHGLIRPHDGARLLHGCASIVGMPLTRELPNTTVIIRGLRKTNDVAQGHHLLITVFGAFGDIVDASISPHNRGFGFVRFVQSQSVEKVMEKYETSEIDIQDVSVSVIPLRKNYFSLYG